MNGYTTRSKVDKPKAKDVANPVLFEYHIDGESGSSNNKTVISFTEHDYRQIQSPRYLNDTIISFFMHYHLENDVEKDLKDRIHIFNSFLFHKIKSMRTKEGERLASTCTSRWLKGITLFDKDFLILPVCEKDHWILIIICYPRNRPNIRSYKIPDEKLYEPAVIVLNSFHSCAPAVKKIISQFLKFCWAHETGTDRTFTINCAKPNGIRLLFPKLPQQRNAYNCGVFILSYFYCFLKDPRGTYLRMFRRRPMTDWFKQNNIDIGAGRRKMNSVIKDQIDKWSRSDLKAQLDKEREACRSSSPESKSKETTTIDIMDEDDPDGPGNHVIVIN